jgi:hypothetical protein
MNQSLIEVTDQTRVWFFWDEDPDKGSFTAEGPDRDKVIALLAGNHVTYIRHLGVVTKMPTSFWWIASAIYCRFPNRQLINPPPAKKIKSLPPDAIP